MRVFLDRPENMKNSLFYHKNRVDINNGSRLRIFFDFLINGKKLFYIFLLGKPYKSRPIKLIIFLNISNKHNSSMKLNFISEILFCKIKRNISKKHCIFFHKSLLIDFNLRFFLSLFSLFLSLLSFVFSYFNLFFFL